MKDSTRTKLFTVHELKVEDVYPDENNPRGEMTGIEELAASIADNGQLRPILVRKTGNVYHLIGGERRWNAVKQLGNPTILAYIADTDEAESTLLELADNQQIPLTDAERARGVQRALFFEQPVARVAASSGLSVERVTAAARGWSVVHDTVAAEDVTFEWAEAIAELEAVDAEAAGKLAAAPADSWRRVYDTIIREMKAAERREEASRIVAESGVELLETVDFARYTYLGAGHFREGATAATIDSSGHVMWYGPPTDDAAASERSEAARLSALVDTWHDAWLTHIAAQSDSKQLRAVADHFWRNGYSARAFNLTGPCEHLTGYVAFIAAVLVAVAENTRLVFTASWAAHNADTALKLLNEFERTGYQASDDEREAVSALRKARAKAKRAAKEAAE
jgi:ParB/RepB/Spo0J family partition protein